MYKLYTDREEVFIAEMKIHNASTKNSIARLIIETNDVNLVFDGKIKDDKCIIPIKKLKGILEEDTKGTIKLELILEDTYFNPWKSDCSVERYSKIEINEIKNTVSNKPSISTVNVTSQQPVNKSVIIEQKTAINTAISQLDYITERLNIKKRNNNPDTLQVLNEFFKENSEFKQYKKYILKEFFCKKTVGKKK